MPRLRVRLQKRLRAFAVILSASLAFSMQADPSKPCKWPEGLRDASWIAAEADTHENRALASAKPLPIFRHRFFLPAAPSSAILHISGLGQYEAHINGLNITSNVLTPGWTVYSKHVLFDTYEVSKLLNAGNNAISVLLGNGMYNVLPDPGRYSKFQRSFGQPKLIAELIVHFANRPDLVITSGTDWMTRSGPITFSNVYGGEDFDARLDPPGWETASFDDSHWARAKRVGGPGGTLVQEKIPPVKAFDRLTPFHITHPRPNLTVYDLGRNVSGWPEISVIGPAGASVKLLAGELLSPTGEVTQRSASAGPDDPDLFLYTLRGGGTAEHAEEWHPRFSYSGFRYVQAEVSTRDVTIVRLRGRFLHDDLKQVGSFESSDRLLNSIHGLIKNAMLSNMVSIFTDCPHREKLGWLEETHLAGTALNYNWNLASLYDKISNDIADSQQADGLVPSIAPEYPAFSGAFRDSPEWGSAVILSPWIAYQFSGNPQSLREHYNSMQRYLAYLDGKTHGHLLDYGLGDWYDIGAGDPGESKLTAKGLTASAIYYQDLTTMARIAMLTGHAHDAEAYSNEARVVKEAFNKRFFHFDRNIYDSGSQTAQAMPLVLGLVPDGHQAAVLAGLVKSVRVTANHVTAGDVGFHYVVRALTDFGRSDVLLDMLSRTDAPSYGAQLAAGATSLTESWDANPKESQNHFMLGDAEEWFYRGLGGIDFDRSRSPGQELRIAPSVVGSLKSVSVSLDSSLGPVKSSWHRESLTSGVLKMEVEIPSNVSARVIFPPTYQGTIQQEQHAPRTDGLCTPKYSANRPRSCQLSGGVYTFTLNRN